MSYLAICRPPGAPPPPWLSALMRALPDDWTFGSPAEGIHVGAGGRWPSHVEARPWGVLIGEARERGGPQLGADAGLTAGRLCEQAWGAYVALICDERSGAWSVFRDPSGALECVAWRLDDTLLVAGELPAWLDPWLPEDLAIDWPALAAMLAEPVRTSGALALSGLAAVAPGTLWSASAGRRTIWSPSMAARRPAPTAAEATLRLPVLVDEVVGAQTGDRVLIELSGGLDSAIVASALQAIGRTPICALNYHVADLGGDERLYARAVAERLGFELTEAMLGEPRLDLGGLAARAQGPRPAFNALDQQHETDVAARCRALGIDTLLTGQGGDHVFFQAPSALIAADSARLGPAMLAILARRLGRSAWSVLGEVVRSRLGWRAPRPRPAWLTPAAWATDERQAAHPWLEDLDMLAPAKRLQAASLAGALSLVGASARGEAARLRHPLLSQPVMEFCLPIGVGELTAGGHDRALARAAFADRLPPCIVGRQGKGRLTSHYGRGVAASLGELRPLLLEGRLVAERLLERDELDAMLSVEHLAWRGGFGVILSLTAVELWVQAWEVRVSRHG